MPALEVEDISVRFGGVVALSRVSVTLDAGRIYGLIGPNGSGKTTLCNAISGFVRPTSGRILVNGEAARSKSYHAVSSGISRTFQDLQIFGEMTALENVMVGLHSTGKTEILGGIVGWPSARREERMMRQRAMAALDYAGVAHLAERPANRLSFGQQRMVELARALVVEPKIVLLDEPAAGLSPPMVERLMSIIQDLRSRRTTSILLIEHVIRLVMGVSDSIIALNNGEKIAEGSPEAVRRDPTVIEAYLGKAIDNA